MSVKTKVRTNIAVSLFLLALAASPLFVPGQGQTPKSLGFKKQISIEIKNPSAIALENEPVILKVDEIRAVAPDFNSYNYAVFEQVGQDYRLVVSQADDLNKDRNHDEIVLIRTLPPSSTTKLDCYYSPAGSLQLMTAAKTAVRVFGASGNAPVGWESNLAGFRFLDGRIEVYGKLYAGLALRKIMSDDMAPQEWGMRLHEARETAGLGGLSLWKGQTRLPFMGAGGASGLEIQRTVLAQGPLRALVKVEYTVARADNNEVGATMFLSSYADNPYSRHDIILHAKSGPGGPIALGAGLEKLGAESFALDKGKGYAASWGRGVERAGEIGLALIFNPSEFAGSEEGALERWIKLNARAGQKQTYWILGGWEKGIVAAASPGATNWPLKVAELSARVRVPVEIRFKRS